MTDLEKILFGIIAVMTAVMVFMAVLIGETMPGTAAICLSTVLIPILFGCSVVDRM